MKKKKNKYPTLRERWLAIRARSTFDSLVTFLSRSRQIRKDYADIIDSMSKSYPGYSYDPKDFLEEIRSGRIKRR